MSIKVHHLRPAPGAKKDKNRKGRGEASKGKTAGRGTKGSGARRNYSAAFEGGRCHYICVYQNCAVSPRQTKLHIR